MRLIYIVLITLTFFMVFTSCNENFSPKDDYEEEYVLHCIIDGRNNFQTAAVLRNFDSPNFDPGNITANPFIEGAEITLTYLGNEYKFKDTIMYSEVEQRFNGPLKLYYLDGFLPTRNSVPVEIKATLPNGKVLTAESQTPISFFIDVEESNRQIPPSDQSDYVNIKWVPSSYNYYQYYIARITIKYEVIKNGGSIIKTIEVPLEYKGEDGISEPQYPAPSRMTGITYPFKNFEKVLESLAETPAQKDSISVSPLINVEILTFDANLAAYYYAGLSQNLYTVRLDEINYSNVNGGYGIFGVTYLEDYVMMFTSGFIQRFGYKLMY